MQIFTNGNELERRFYKFVVNFARLHCCKYICMYVYMYVYTNSCKYLFVCAYLDIYMCHVAAHCCLSSVIKVQLKHMRTYSFVCICVQK